jgi:hypothetical protein
MVVAITRPTDADNKTGVSATTVLLLLWHTMVNGSTARPGHRAELGTRHNLTVPSRDPEASVSPDGEKATLFTLSAWPFTARSKAPSDTLHQRTSYQALPAASMAPSGEKATLPIPPRTEASLRRGRHPSVLQSLRPAARIDPSGEKAAAVVTDSPLIVCTGAPLETSHKVTVRSSEAEASVTPTGEKAISTTPLE